MLFQKSSYAGRETVAKVYSLVKMVVSLSSAPSKLKSNQNAMLYIPSGNYDIKRDKMVLYRSREYLTSFESICHSVQEKQFKIRFKDGGYGGRLGFLIGTFSATFDLQVTLILPIKFPVNSPFAFGETVQNIFARWQLSFSDRNDFSYFLFIWHSDTSYQVSSSKYVFKMSVIASILDFRSKRLFQDGRRILDF